VSCKDKKSVIDDGCTAKSFRLVGGVRKEAESRKQLKTLKVLFVMILKWGQKGAFAPSKPKFL
jgi:hypothetical protein